MRQNRMFTKIIGRLLASMAACSPVVAMKHDQARISPRLRVAKRGGIVCVFVVGRFFDKNGEMVMWLYIPGYFRFGDFRHPDGLGGTMAYAFKN